MVPAREGPWRPVEGGILVRVRLTPRGGRDAIDGVEELGNGERVLKARVRAIAAEGAANEALTALLARAAGVRRGCVRLVGGATARLKTFKIEGDPPALAARLTAQGTDAAA